MDIIMPALKGEDHSINNNIRQGICFELKEILLYLVKGEIFS